jgi:competence protein ComFC
MELLHRIKSFVLDTLFPPLCLSCGNHLVGKFITPLCAVCESSIAFFDALSCPVCRARLADGVKICHNKSDYILAAATPYQNPVIQKLIWQLKYGRHQPAAEALGELLAKYLTGLQIATLTDFIIIPVPLHPSRQRHRGFNQSAVIGQALSKRLAIPTLESVLIKTKVTQPQTELRSWDERRKNLSDCFKLTDLSQITDKNIFLLDDVSTSGATLTACAEVLKSAHPKKIIGLVVARA